MNGALVWVTGVDSRKVTVRPTNREMGSVFAGQTDGLRGEALGSALVVSICDQVPQPSWQSRAFTSSRAGLFKVGSTPEIYLVFVLVCVASSHIDLWSHGGPMHQEPSPPFPDPGASATPQAGLSVLLWDLASQDAPGLRCLLTP